MLPIKLTTLGSVLLMSISCVQGLAREIHVLANADADSANGSSSRPFTRIEQAMQEAGAGDTVIIGDGIYRECIRPARGGEDGKPLVITAAPGANPIIRGTDLFVAEWETVKAPDGGHYYQAKLDEALFVDYGLPWQESFAGPGNPFRSKVVISNLGTKTSYDLQARPWVESSASGNEGEAAVTFDTDNRKVVYDGPPGTLPKTLGQVFVDDKPMRQASSMEDFLLAPEVFLVSETGNELMLNLPEGQKPSDVELEITTRAQCLSPLQRGLNHIVVRGLTFERAANQGPFPQAGMVSTRSGSYWVIENCRILHATTIGIDCGGETYINSDTSGVDGGSRRTTGVVIQNCEISDNGLSGIAAYGTRDLRLINNLLERNNRIDYIPRLNAGWWELAAIKLHNAPGALIQGNLIRDNEAFGIWVDTGFSGARITRNTILNNKLAGIFGEASKGPFLVDNNVIAYTRSGHGIYMHDGSGVFILHNLTFRNAGCGVFLRNVRPLNTPYQTSENLILGNLLWGDYTAAVGLPLADDKKNRDNFSDWNVLSGGTHFFDPGPVTMILHSRTRGFMDKLPFADGIGPIASYTWKDEDVVLLDLEAWQGATGYDTHSIAPFPLDSLYVGLRARDLSFECEIPEALSAYRVGDLPEEVSAKLGILEDTFSKQEAYSSPFPGPFGQLPMGRCIIPIYPLSHR